MNSSLKYQILEKIKKGGVKMKPRFYFILKGIFFFGFFALILGFSFLFCSFIHFHLVSSGIWYLPRFGVLGFLVFLKSLPWILIALAIFLILILEILSRKFSFSFKRPILFSLLAIIFIIFLGSFLIVKTEIHPKLFLKANEKNFLPPISPIYLKYGIPKYKEFHRGVIEKVSTSSIFLKKLNGELLEIEIKEPFLSEKFREGEGIMIFDKEKNGKPKELKIKKINDKFLEFERKIINSHLRMK